MNRIQQIERLAVLLLVMIEHQMQIIRDLGEHPMRSYFTDRVKDMVHSLIHELEIDEEEIIREIETENEEFLNYLARIQSAITEAKKKTPGAEIFDEIIYVTKWNHRKIISALSWHEKQTTNDVATSFAGMKPLITELLSRVEEL